MQEVFKKIIEKLELNSFELGKDSFPAHYVRLNKAIEIINQVAAKHNNGWIPCSERLPEDEQVVLTCKCNNISILRYSAQTNHWYELNGNWWWTSNMVIAWQPLPEPYQPKGE